MTEFLLPAALLAGLLIGAVAAWLLARSRASALLEAATAKVDATYQVELAQMRERARAADEIRRQVLEELSASKHGADSYRAELEEARQDVATLKERASRVPELELELQQIEQRLRDSTSEATRLGRESSEKAAAFGLLNDTVVALRDEKTALVAQLDASEAALNSANERKAALEEQVQQIDPLRRELATSVQQLETTTIQLSNLRENSAGELSSLKNQTHSDHEALELLRQELQSERAARAGAQSSAQILTGELREARTLLDTEREHAAQRLADLLAAKESLTAQFKSLASDILEEKSKRFAEQNQASLGQLLEPLKGQLTEFKAKVEEVYVNEGKDRSALASQVKELVGLNHALSQDAKNLTSALKGSSKTQGNWGELILERVLEASGLRKNHEYVVQDSQRNEDGTRQLPDVVINLPGDRRLVVDAKVSLVAYEQYVSAEADEARALALRRHLDSVRGHIKLLSEKKYQQLYQLQTLDFVLMFVPVEPAFMSAVTHDDSLFMNAWERNVLLVSPSTLLFVVRTVAHLWRQESQSRNAQDIAKRGAELYDKLVDFVKDLENVGDKLSAAQKSYADAHKRLSTGKGNIIRQADMLRSLGVKPSKLLAQQLVDVAVDEIVVSDGATLAALAATHPSALIATNSSSGT